LLLLLLLLLSFNICTYTDDVSLGELKFMYTRQRGELKRVRVEMVQLKDQVTGLQAQNDLLRQKLVEAEQKT